MSLSVSVAAPDRSLVTAAEVLAAIGKTVTAATILQVSDLVSDECRVARGGVAQPTLRAETLVETLRLSMPKKEIALSRRFVASVSSITVDGVALGASDYEANGESGILFRLGASGDVICWETGKIVITYVAGFATVPEPLKLAAIRVLQEQISASARDPLLRGETVDGIGRFDYWVNSSGGSVASPISAAVAAMLDPYRSIYV